MRVLERISCINFVEKDGYAFFSNQFYNGLFRVEIKTGRTDFLGSFENERISRRNIHKEIFLENRKIYFCPRRGRHIHIYDLIDTTIQAVELRSKSEKPFLIEEVVVEGDNIYFVPDQKDCAIRKFNRKTFLLTQTNEKNGFYGQYLSQNKEIFPASGLMKEYPIEYDLRDDFWGKWETDEVWYGFLPMGRQIIKYIKNRNRLEIMPLALTDRKNFKRYLWKVKMELMKDGIVSEEEISFRDWLSITVQGEIHKQKGFRSNCIGNNMWKLEKE